MRLTALFLILALFSCNNNTPKTADDLRNELIEKEQTTPTKYLSAAGKLEADGTNEFTLSGTISNTATLAKFKDVLIEVIFYSQTDTQISMDTVVVYKFFKPNSKTDFSIQLKNVPVENTKRFDVDVISATPTN